MPLMDGDFLQLCSRMMLATAAFLTEGRFRGDILLCNLVFRN